MTHEDKNSKLPIHTQRLQAKKLNLLNNLGSLNSQSKRTEYREAKLMNINIHKSCNH